MMMIYIFSTIKAVDCMYSKLPPEDEQLIYSKHVEDFIGMNLKRKVHLVGSYYAKVVGCLSMVMNLRVP